MALCKTDMSAPSFSTNDHLALLPLCGLFIYLAPSKGYTSTIHLVFGRGDTCDGEVADHTPMVKGLARAWGDLGWKVSTWVHWTCAHSPFVLMKEYKKIIVFSSIPSKRKNCFVEKNP